jgi:hypothetical protein
MSLIMTLRKKNKKRMRRRGRTRILKKMII